MKLCFIFICTIVTAIHAEILRPIEANIQYNQNKAKLGKKLFFDPGLSKDGTIACVNCHALPGSGADSKSYSTGIRAQEGDINTPTVLNSSLSFVQMWDGRAKTLQDQVHLPITNPKEMDNSMRNVITYLSSKPEYVKAFKKIYSHGISEQSVSDAIAEFEKALITPRSRFDRFLMGETHLLTPLEKKGKDLFSSLGCISCHNGTAVGGYMYQKFGIFNHHRSDKNQLGRYNVTLREEDRYVFKVPTLRNIALTAPYFHDGSAKTLKDAIMLMGFYQLGIRLQKDQIDALEAFLHTLTGETPRILRAKP